MKISSTKEKKKIEFPTDLNMGNLTCDYKNKKNINFEGALGENTSTVKKVNN
jgi:hypothetical protein